MVRNVKNGTEPHIDNVILTAEGVRWGLIRLFPISVFVVPFGIGFGAAAIEAGLTPTQAIAMSALSFSGAAQFAALEFLTEPIAYVSLMLVVLALNARHIIMGAALARWVNHLPLEQRALALVWLTDATFAERQPALKDGDCDLGRLVGGGLIMWFTWILGTAIGIAGGSLLTDPAYAGVDVVMVCFFAALVTGQVQKDRLMIMPVSVAAIIAITTLDALPVGWNVILAAFAGGLISVFHRAN